MNNELNNQEQMNQQLPVEQPVQPVSEQPVTNMPGVTPNEPKNSNKGLIIICVAVIAIIVVAVIFILSINSEKDKVGKGKTTTTNQVTESTPTAQAQDPDDGDGLDDNFALIEDSYKIGEYEYYVMEIKNFKDEKGNFYSDEFDNLKVSAAAAYKEIGQFEEGDELDPERVHINYVINGKNVYSDNYVFVDKKNNCKFILAYKDNKFEFLIVENYYTMDVGDSHLLVYDKNGKSYEYGQGDAQTDINYVNYEITNDGITIYNTGGEGYTITDSTGAPIKQN